MTARDRFPACRDELVRLWAANVNVAGICSALNITEGTLWMWQKRAELPRRARVAKPARVNRDELRAAWMAGIQIADIAIQCDVSISHVSKLACEMGLPYRRRTKPPGLCIPLTDRIPKARNEVRPQPVRVVARAPTVAPVIVQKATNSAPHPFWTPERDLAVIATQGRWKAITDAASALGVSVQQITQRWHQVRVMG